MDVMYPMNMSPQNHNESHVPICSYYKVSKKLY